MAFIGGKLTGDTKIDGTKSVATPENSLTITATTTNANTIIAAKDLAIKSGGDTLTTGASSSLTLLGSGGTGKVLTGSTGAVGNLTMGNGATVNLGSLPAKEAGITAPQGGTIGTIGYDVAGGTINVEAGSFTSGKITGGAGADTLNVTAATLTANGVDLAAGANTLKVAQGTLNSTGAIAATDGTVTLDSVVKFKKLC